MFKRLSILSLSVLPLAAMGAEEVVTLPDIIVAAESADDIETNQTASTTRFNREALSAFNKADLNSALRGLGGVGVSQGTPATNSNIILRGASGGLGLVNLDGVPLFGNFTGFFPLSHYPLDFLEQVNVSRGFNGEQNSSRTLGAVHAINWAIGRLLVVVLIFLRGLVRRVRRMGAVILKVLR